MKHAQKERKIDKKRDLLSKPRKREGLLSFNLAWLEFKGGLSL